MTIYGSKFQIPIAWKLDEFLLCEKVSKNQHLTAHQMANESRVPFKLSQMPWNMQPFFQQCGTPQVCRIPPQNGTII